MTDYNYESYGWALEQGAYERWLAEAPRLGETAPDFSLADSDGVSYRLGDLRGRPVVLEFGSYTCPMFCDRIPQMEDLVVAHPEAAFLIVYSREAHPGERTGPHRTEADKLAAARTLVADEPLTRTVLVDDLDGTVHRAYGAVWDPVFVLDAAGRVVCRLAWNDPGKVATLLQGLRRDGQVEPLESVEMLRAPSPQGFGHGLLRGGVRAVLDFYHAGPPGGRERLEASESAAVRATLRSSPEAGRPSEAEPT
ncbi:MAG: peroxiredoxin family protein [Acidimicrobiales bacterium]